MGDERTNRTARYLIERYFDGRLSEHQRYQLAELLGQPEVIELFLTYLQAQAAVSVWLEQKMCMIEARSIVDTLL